MKLTFKKIKEDLSSSSSKPLVLEKEVKRALQVYGQYYERAVEKGSAFVAKSTKKYGGKPTSGEKYAYCNNIQLLRRLMLQPSIKQY